MRKNSKIYLRLIALAILLISFSEAEAQFSFSSSNFTVVDRTKVFGNPLGSFTTNIGGNPNRYQLTDTFFNQTLAMWYKSQRLDLSKDFVFNFRLYFGDGRPRYYVIALLPMALYL